MQLIIYEQKFYYQICLSSPISFPTRALPYKFPDLTMTLDIRSIRWEKQLSNRHVYIYALFCIRRCYLAARRDVNEQISDIRSKFVTICSCTYAVGRYIVLETEYSRARPPLDVSDFLARLMARRNPLTCFATWVSVYTLRGCGHFGALTRVWGKIPVWRENMFKAVGYMVQYCVTR